MKHLNTALLTQLLASHRDALRASAFNFDNELSVRRVQEQADLLATPCSLSQLEKDGGRWLAAVRSWIQSRCLNGSDVNWSSDTPLTFSSPLTVKDLETLATYIAATAVDEFKGLLK